MVYILRGMIVFLCFTCIGSAMGQVSRYNPFFVRDTAESVSVSAFKLTKLGQHYYDNTWNAGNIYLTNGDSLFGYYIRYDIVKNSLEIIIDNAFKSINKAQIGGFEWFSVNRLKVEKFVNRDEYGFNFSEMSTFFPEVLEDGDVVLLKVKELISKRKSAAPSLINNEGGEGIIILDKLYYYRNGVLEEVPGGKRKNLEFFDSDEIEDYVRDNNFNFSNEADVKRVVRYFNSL